MASIVSAPRWLDRASDHRDGDLACHEPATTAGDAALVEDRQPGHPGLATQPGDQGRATPGARGAREGALGVHQG
jgi:hypothetical protein